MYWFIFIVYAVACGSYCMELASQKRQNEWAWLIGGLCFGILALIAAAGLPMRDRPKA